MKNKLALVTLLFLLPQFCFANQGLKGLEGLWYLVIFIVGLYVVVGLLNLYFCTKAKNRNSGMFFTGVVLTIVQILLAVSICKKIITTAIEYNHFYWSELPFFILPWIFPLINIYYLSKTEGK
jgi:hypothetical protein